MMSITRNRSNKVVGTMIRGRRASQIVKHTALTLLVVLSLFPFYYMIVTSFKNSEQFFTTYWWPAWPMHFENYLEAWESVGRPLLNSLYVSSASVLGILAAASLASYGFARFSELKGSQALFYGIIFLLMMPSILTLVPAFMITKSLGLLNTFGGLIIPYIAGGQAFSILVLRSFFEATPRDFFDSAEIDGASELRIFVRIALPMCMSSLGIIAVWAFLGTWNNYIWPLIVIRRSSHFVVTIALAFFQGQYGSKYGTLFAGYTIASVPIVLLYLFTMKRFIRGFAEGAIKM
jgi:ABC-type glycerol-3-phosphate transport system permease component